MAVIITIIILFPPCEILNFRNIAMETGYKFC